MCQYIFSLSTGLNGKGPGSMCLYHNIDTLVTLGNKLFQHKEVSLPPDHSRVLLNGSL